MKSIMQGELSPEQIDAIAHAAESLTDNQSKEFLWNIVFCLRSGDQIVGITPDSTLTPNQAAKKLGMSRTHLYKLLDNGTIPFHRVGRDRRIFIGDLVAFEEQRSADRRELAERFAKQDQTRIGAINELTDLI
ncbi:MAG: helix-turn-helix domain-containing protein [Ancrocorticia sp.]